MSIIDYKSAIDTKAWGLLEANTDFTSIFKAQCRFKDDKSDTMKKNILQTWTTDATQIRIQVTGGSPISRGAPMTFGMQRITYTVADVDFSLPVICKLKVQMAFDDASTSKAYQFAADDLVRSIWMSAFPKFGLAYCHDFTITDEKKYERLEGGKIKLDVITQLLTFNLQPKLSQLVA